MGNGKVIAYGAAAVGVIILLLGYLDEKSKRLVAEDELEKKDEESLNARRMTI